MLKKQIKLPSDIEINFSFVKEEKFLILKKKSVNTSFYVKVPQGIKICKEKLTLFLFINFSTNINSLKGFYTYTIGVLNCLKSPTKKTLILRGLGLKCFIANSVLHLKLGYSHENLLNVEDKKYNFLYGKNFLSILGFNKVFIGNFVEKIYRIKKANCYKSRGLYYKSRKLFLKPIKKS